MHKGLICKDCFIDSKARYPKIYPCWAFAGPPGAAAGLKRGQVESAHTLANENATRVWRLNADFAQRLIGFSRQISTNPSVSI
jgi:hypothetical protein